MSASTRTGQVGRPAGNDPETLAKGREFLTLLEYGVTADAIAQRSGLSRSTVYYAINLARTAAAEARTEPSPAAEAAPVRKPRKLSEGTLLRRAYNAIRNVRAFKGLLDAETREFWVETLIEIRDLSDDGIHLTFGGAEDIYTSQGEFLGVFGLPETHLAKLFRHAMLVDLDGGGVAMPHRWGLRGNPARQPGPARRTSQRPLPFPFQVVKGGPPESEETPILSDSMSKETAIYSDSNSEETPILSDSAGVARIAAAAAKDILNQTLSSSSSPLDGRARESEEIAVESERIASESEEIKLQRSAAGKLADDLAARAMLGRVASPVEVDQVQLWLKDGLNPDLLGEVIGKRMQRRVGEPPVALMYFDKAMQEARRKSAVRPAPTPAAALPPEPSRPTPPTAEDLLKQDLSKRWDRWRDSGRRGPMPPLIDAFKPYLGKPQEAMARRWLAIFDAWHAAGHRHDARPPEFVATMRDPEALEAELLACEDALSRPDDAGG